MYSDYGALGVDCRKLADLRRYQMMQQTASMTHDWLRVLPTSRSQLAGDWHAYFSEIQKWRSASAVGTVVPATETTQSQPPNLGGEKTARSSPYWNPRWHRLDTNDDGQGSKDRAPGERGRVERRRRRFDFTRLAESATSRDDSSSAGSDTEFTRSNDSGGAKVVTHDDDQSDRRLSLKPPTVQEDADKRSLLWSLSQHPTLPQLNSVINPTASFEGYISSALFNDKIRLRQCNEPISKRDRLTCVLLYAYSLCENECLSHLLYDVVA